MAPTIIFDGDDTLWELQPLYDRAMFDFARLLSAELATSPEFIRDELLRIDASNVAQFGFGERRFSHSMSTLYERQCFVLGRPVLFDTKTKIANMAATVSTVFPKPMDGAREVLHGICAQYQLILYSGGASTIQVQKVRNLGFDTFFTRMYFSDTKSVGDLKKIVLENHLLPATTLDGWKQPQVRYQPCPFRRVELHLDRIRYVEVR